MRSCQLMKILLALFLLIYDGCRAALDSLTDDEKVQQSCFMKCKCETFLLPTVSTSDVGWPLLKSTAMLSDVLANSYTKSSTFESLISSIQNEQNQNPMPNSLPTTAPKFQEHSMSPKEYLLSTLARANSAILPGEVSANCSSMEISKISDIVGYENDSLLSILVKM